MTLARISVDKAATLAKEGATLIDIRSAGEFSHRHINDSVNKQVNAISPDSLPEDGVVIFLCNQVCALGPTPISWLLQQKIVKRPTS